MRFEDLHEFDGQYVYTIPNEGLPPWNRLLNVVPAIKRAAGICSSGEVGLLSLLPRVEDELVLIDHSYKSLAVAMSKFELLRERGAQELVRLFSSADQTAVTEALIKAAEKLPKPVQDGFARLRDLPGCFSGESYDRLARDLTQVWSKVRPEQVEPLVSKLDKVCFLHGDLSDLVKRGPFDLLYLSNALDDSHISRDGWNGREALKKSLIEAVRPGGYVLSCSYDAQGPGQLVRTEKASYDECGTLWNYKLYQREAVAQPARFPVAA